MRKQNADQARAASDGVDSGVQVVKAVPASQSELERIPNAYKFYSPVQKACKVASPPQEGEKWKLKRTLPSGLLVGPPQKITPWWLAIFTRKTVIQSAYHDVRHLQYKSERQLLREDPNLLVQTRNTYTVAWHPTERLLVTAGDGINTKIWDTETGELISPKLPFYSTSSGDSFSWSYDGEVFTIDKDLFDGRTGELLPGPGPGKDSYSGGSYAHLRGISRFVWGTSPPASSHNFSPWRPNSNQYVITDRQAWQSGKWALNPWKPSSGQSDTCLVFRNRRTGEIEKVIDCGAHSTIKDFAWHPSGQFIAVAFEEHNVLIIDIENVRTVASLSVQHLVGWSPDGKTLVLRKEEGVDDFIVWDAIEFKERPMPEEVRDQLWFKRFFANISADGLRYINGIGIYAMDSGELIAELPSSEQVRSAAYLGSLIKSAAWSPLDGGLLATCDGGSETQIWQLRA